jgi:hypothetical protein
MTKKANSIKYQQISSCLTAHWRNMDQKLRRLATCCVAPSPLRLNEFGPKARPQTSAFDDPRTIAGGRILNTKIQELSPQNDMQRRLQSEALQINADLGRARWLLVAQREGTSIPNPFLIVLVFWLTVPFASFGLFASSNGTVIATLFVCALSVSGAIFLILDFAQPFAGVMQISSAPLRNALAHLGQ